MNTHAISVDGNVPDPNTGDVQTNVVVLKSKTIATHSQILSLPTTPIQIIPAPGANKIVTIYSVTAIAKFTSIYSNISSGGLSYDAALVLMYYSSPAAGLDVSNHVNSEFLLSNINFATSFTHNVGNDINVGGTNRVYNQGDTIDKSIALYAYNALGNYTGGHPDNTLEITAVYSIIDLA